MPKIKEVLKRHKSSPRRGSRTRLRRFCDLEGTVTRWSRVFFSVVNFWCPDYASMHQDEEGTPPLACRMVGLRRSLPVFSAMADIVIDWHCRSCCFITETAKCEYPLRPSRMSKSSLGPPAEHFRAGGGGRESMLKKSLFSHFSRKCVAEYRVASFRPLLLRPIFSHLGQW